MESGENINLTTSFNVKSESIIIITNNSIRL